MPRGSRKNQPCSPQQLRSPETHSCRNCSAYSELDLKEFAHQLNIPLNEDMTKAELCSALKGNLTSEQQQHFDRKMLSIRHFLAEVLITILEENE